jgi:hypothetical protein
LLKSDWLVCCDSAVRLKTVYSDTLGIFSAIREFEISLILFRYLFSLRGEKKGSDQAARRLVLVG